MKRKKTKQKSMLEPICDSHLSGGTSPYLKHSQKDLFHQILKINLEKLKENEAVIRETFLPEAIHDMRVASRRLRAAIKTFKRALPTKAQRLRAQLEKFSRSLGIQRDFDVFSEFILQTINDKSSSFQKVVKKITQAQKKILTMLRSKYYQRLIKSLQKLQTTKINPIVCKVSKKKILKELNHVLTIAPSINAKVNDKTLHKLRISIKKLRYVCEFYEPSFHFLGHFIEKTKLIQDTLGDHQDAITGIAMLIRYKKKFSSEEFLQIKKNYELKKIKTRNLFLKIWKSYCTRSLPLTPKFDIRSL